MRLILHCQFSIKYLSLQGKLKSSADMYRQIFVPSEQNHVVAIPRKWFGYEIEVLVFPVKKPDAQQDEPPRRHWAEAARQMHLAGDDKLFAPAVLDNENTDWWTWEE
jgi:hypothetical protein